MTTMAAAITVLETAQDSLNGLASEALNGGNYAVAREIIVCAEQVTFLKRRLSGGVVAAEGGESPAEPASGEAPHMQSSPRRVTPNRKAAGRGRRRQYPKFLRRKDELVKVGWSKSEKCEYVHRAPRRVLEIVGIAVDRVGRDAALFDVDALVTLEDVGRQGDIPSYQTYLCLAWLRHENLIERHGRQGYTISVQDLASAIKERWQSLPTK